MVCHALTFARSRRFSTSPKGPGECFMHWKTMFDRSYCIKTENICYISRYFFTLFSFAFSQMSRERNFPTNYARSRAGQYTSCNGSKSVAPVRSYWKLRRRALTARELPCWYTAVNNVRHCLLCNNNLMGLAILGRLYCHSYRVDLF